MERVSLPRLLGVRKPIIGMVHLLPLPGAPRWGGSMDQVLDRAGDDARALAQGGLHALMIENFLDVPFYPEHVPPETVAAMAVAVALVARAVDIPVGVNVLRNDAAAALAIAAATGARFIRVNVHTGVMLADQGRLQGRAHQTLRLRERLATPQAPIAIMADVLVKHALPPAGADLARTALDTWHRGLADALIVSGAATGEPTDLERLRVVRQALPEAPLFVGSGLTPGNAASLLTVADGAIVGSVLAHGGSAGAGIDPARVRALMDALPAHGHHGDDAGD